MSALSLSSLKIRRSDNFDSSSANKTSNPRSREQFSSFGDSACGEPLFTQHILVDFTPDDKIDNEIVQNKICGFWQFIKNNPEIRNLKVKPEKYSYSRPSTTVEVDENQPEPKYSENSDVISFDRTAVSMLEVVEKKGLITRTFEAKMPHSRCSLDSKEYKENQPNIQKNGKRRKNRAPIMCKCKSMCQPCPMHAKSMTDAKLLCKTLTEWDAQHPKSMEPPSRSPLLHHCIIQRQVYP